VVLVNAKKKNKVLVVTLNPSLEEIFVEIMDAIEPNNIAPNIDAKTIIGTVIRLNSAKSENKINPIPVVKNALIIPIVPIVVMLARI
jgi:hypothetical protein